MVTPEFLKDAQARIQAGYIAEQKSEERKVTLAERRRQRISQDYETLVKPVLNQAESDFWDNRVPQDLKDLFTQAKEEIEKKEKGSEHSYHTVKGFEKVSGDISLKESRVFTHQPVEVDKLVKLAKAGNLDPQKVVTGVSVSYVANVVIPGNERLETVYGRPGTIKRKSPDSTLIYNLGFSFNKRNRSFSVKVGEGNRTFAEMQRLRKSRQESNVVFDSMSESGFKQTFRRYSQANLEMAAEMLVDTLKNSEYKYFHRPHLVAQILNQ